MLPVLDHVGVKEHYISLSRLSSVGCYRCSCKVLAPSAGLGVTLLSPSK